ncbi:hypothetical protein MLD38_025939 [Melastoma candidum]|uniref:Uncharacterized protein n=1 Tax=Melastoma candidum TaxID=119954 RepID=A0ACB9NXG2_9MYRT|nr:hypothetical protein MLD38_025939 [Melastoma candidum]
MILALANRHHAEDLKFICLKFAVENPVAVMRSDGFEYLKEKCPSLQSEILKALAGCDEEVSGGGKSQDVCPQFSCCTTNQTVNPQFWANLKCKISDFVGPHQGRQ